MTDVKWFEPSAERATATVYDLGAIAIYWDNGWAVDINGKRAWSNWYGTKQSVMFGMQDRIRNWHYLNSFRRK